MFQNLNADDLKSIKYFAVFNKSDDVKNMSFENNNAIDKH